MADPKEIDGSVYLPVTSDELKVEAGVAGTHLRRTLDLLDKVEELERKIGLKRLGTCEPVLDGQTRILEFDAQRLSSSGFPERWADHTDWRKRKVKIYDLEAGHGNAILTDLMKPRYDPDARALAFSLDRPVGGMPRFINAFKTGPLFGGSNDGWQTTGGHAIVTSERFRLAFDVEFSENWWDHFKTIQDKTTSRWLSLVQIKQSYSYVPGQVISLSWSWSEDEPRFRIAQTGHSRDDEVGRNHPSKREGYHRNDDAPITPGVRQHVEFELRFSSEHDGSAYTRVEIDGVEYLNHNDVNCFPLTTLDRERFPDRQVHLRGIYFGGYWGARPSIIFPGADIWVRYSNVSVDVGEPTE